MTRRNLTISILLGLAATAAVVALVRWSGGSDSGSVSTVATEGLPDLMVAPASIEFGEVPVGELSRRSVSITNLGDEPMVFEEVRIAEPFRVPGTAFTLEPGASYEVSVGFGSREPGTYEDKALELVSRALGTVQVPVRAFIQVPQQVVVEPRALEFGEVELGKVASAMLTVSNPGKRPLKISGLGAIPPFSSGPNPTVIGPEESIVVEVFYKPDAIGKAQGSFRIRSDDPIWPSFSISLKGTGTPEEPNPRMIASNDALEFGQVSIGDVRTKWLAVTNRGYSPLTVRSVTAEKPFGGPKKGRTLKSGAVFRFPVTFSPADAGALLGALMIHSNDPDAEPLVISLLGEGISEGETTYAAQTRRWMEGKGKGRRSGGAVKGEKGEAGQDVAYIDDAYSHLPEWAREDIVSDDPTRPTPANDPPEDVQVGDTLSVVEGSKVAIGARTADIGPSTFESIRWTEDGQFEIEGFQLPTVQMPFGDSFEFGRIEGPVTSTVDADGYRVLRFTVPVTNAAGKTVDVTWDLTTGPTDQVGERESRFGGEDGCVIQMVGQTQIPAEKEWKDLVLAADLSLQVPSCL